MIGLESRQAVADLAGALLAAGPMMALLSAPVRVTAGTGADLPCAVNWVAAELGLPEIAGDAPPAGPPDAERPFHQVVGDRLGLPALASALGGLTGRDVPAVRAQVERVAAGDFHRLCEQWDVTTGDGALVRGYVAGEPGAPPIVLSSACGMPARLLEPWIRHLAPSFRVVTWESRGTGRETGRDMATGVAAQVSDGLAVMAALGVNGAHVAGLCGGAVVAARMAALAPGRVRSVSLWHGDLDLGDDAPKTDHQRNLLGLMDLVMDRPQDAVSVHQVICHSMLGTVPTDLAPLVLCPYVTPELFLHYSRLNGAIMHHDLRPTLGQVRQPALVVTSATDSTAHPQGSIAAADRLPDARLVVEPAGDHISLFRGDAALLALLDDFLATRGGADEPVPVLNGARRPAAGSPSLTPNDRSGGVPGYPQWR